ncbi:IS3 family transposase [Pilimelia terevasa]|uniref:IS3 family transposase n=1 Tax=Pilimelia terevasa TaxID=53372 RepID=UPI0035710A28
MPAPRKFDDETRARAVRLYQDRIRENGDSKVEARRQVGALLGINPATLRNWIERDEVDTGMRPGIPSEVDAEVKALRRRVVELERANEILKTASAFFAPGGARPPTQVIVSFIDRYRRRFGVEPICAVLTLHGCSIAPSTYYARRGCRVSPAVLAEAYLVNTLVDLFVANRRVYGVRKLWHAMRRAGHQIGRDAVARLMRIAGIRGAVRGRHRIRTTDSDRTAARHPDLVGRNWAGPSAPDQLWVADFTYVWTLAGFVYVALLTDVYSRRILGWRVSTSKATPLVTSVLEQAVFTRRRHNMQFTPTGLVHHSDAGSQYVSLAFTEALVEAGIAGSIGSVGDALDNALMESTIGLYKTELIDNHHRTWTGRAEVERETAAWVHWYNTSRLHSATGYTPPIEFEHHHHPHQPATQHTAAA